jgi:hypothetical protein
MTVVKVFPFALAAPFGIRQLVYTTAIAIGLVVVTLPLVGVGSWVTYVAALGAVDPVCGDPHWANYSVACIIGSTGGVLLGGFALVIGILAGRTAIGWAAVVVAIMAPASELHLHYFVLLYILAWIIVAEVVRRVGGRDPGQLEAAAAGPD